jgi:hypothetical protein
MALMMEAVRTSVTSINFYQPASIVLMMVALSTSQPLANFYPTTIIALMTTMMEAVCTSKTSVSFYPTTRRNIPKDSHLERYFVQLTAASCSTVLATLCCPTGSGCCDETVSPPGCKQERALSRPGTYRAAR